MKDTRKVILRLYRKETKDYIFICGKHRVISKDPKHLDNGVSDSLTNEALFRKVFRIVDATYNPEYRSKKQLAKEAVQNLKNILR
jgi:hypothetical protein